MFEIAKDLYSLLDKAMSGLPLPTQEIVNTNIKTLIDLVREKSFLKETFQDWFGFESEFPWVCTRHRYGWKLPTEEAIQEISKYKSICEIGAGSGYWSAILQSRGCNVQAIDNQSWNSDTWWTNSWFPIKRMSVQEIIPLPNVLYLCIYPAYSLKNIVKHATKIAICSPLLACSNYCADDILNLYNNFELKKRCKGLNIFLEPTDDRVDSDILIFERTGKTNPWLFRYYKKELENLPHIKM